MRCGASVVGVLGLVVLGCGPSSSGALDAPAFDAAGPDLNDGAHSGTRLKLRYHDFGAVRDLVGVFDTERDEPCFPQEWSDGAWYCVPSDRGSIVYANATCTDVVGRTPRDAACTTQLPPPAYFLEYGYAGCQSQPARLHTRGAKIALTSYFDKTSDGSCAGPFTDLNAEFWSVDAEVAVTELAATPVSAPSTTGRLGLRYHESSDGLRFPLRYRLHDALLGTDCTPTYDRPGDQVARCAPANAGYAAYFQDAACTQPQVQQQAICAAPKYAVQYGECPRDPARYFVVGGQVTPPPLYYSSGASCNPLPPSMSSAYYTVGGELTLATPARERATSGGRIEAIYYTTAEGLRSRDSTLHDTELDAECFPFTQADGTIACIPSANGTSTYYTDAACQTAIELMSDYRGAATCEPPPLLPYAIDVVQTASTCRYTYQVHTVGAVYTGPLYVKSGTSCFSYTPTTSIMYRVGPAIPASDLATAELVTEP